MNTAPEKNVSEENSEEKRTPAEVSGEAEVPVLAEAKAKKDVRVSALTAR